MDVLVATCFAQCGDLAETLVANVSATISKEIQGSLAVSAEEIRTYLADIIVGQYIIGGLVIYFGATLSMGMIVFLYRL